MNFLGKHQVTSIKQVAKKKSHYPAKITTVPLLRTTDCAGGSNIKTRSSVWKQTSKIQVKQVREESDKCTETKDNSKPRSPKLRHKAAQKKESHECEENNHKDSFKDIQSLSDSSVLVNGTSFIHVDISINKEKENVNRTKIKGREAIRDTNVRTEKSDQKQPPSAAISVLAHENDQDLDQTISRDTGARSNINLPVVVSALTNGILGQPPLSSHHCVEYSIEKSDSDLSNKCSENEDSNNKRAKTAVLYVKSNTASNQKTGRDKLHDTDSITIVNIERDCADLKSDEDMHYKKQILRAGSNINPSPNSPQSLPVSESVTVNYLLTDQPTKGRSSDKCSLKSDGKVRSEVVNTTKTLSSPVFGSSHHDNRSESSSLSMPHDANSERQSAFTSVQSSLSRSRQNTPTVIDRADSRSSDGQLSVYLSDSKQANSRLDDVRSVKSSPGTSPLIVDRNETVNPYRDPDLMRASTVHSHIQNVLTAHHKMSQPVFPSTHSSVPGISSSPAATAFSNVSTLPARSLLSTLPSTLPYTSTHQLLPSISHHLALPHGYPMEAIVRAQQQQQLAALQQQHLLGYTLNSASTLATLEALWQQKFSATPLPAHYVLKKSQESLLSTEIATALHREHLQLQMDHGRREMEAGCRERERLEQERREKEHTEIIER